MTSDNDQAKTRQRIRQLRRALTPEQRRHAAEQIATHLSHFGPFQRARDIALYLAFDGECDPAPLQVVAMERHKRCYLPVLGNHGYGGLWFAPSTADSLYKPNCFGIPEPVHGRRERRRAQQLDLIVMPLVAFDTQGHRIGMGGGYYDRTLAFTRHRRPWRRPLLVGLAYDFQRIERIRANAWDVALDAIATPDGILTPKTTTDAKQR